MRSASSVGPASAGRRGERCSRAWPSHALRLGLALWAPLHFASGSAHADPFPTRDQNPLLAGFGLPTPMPARPSDDGKWHAGIDFNWGSSAILQDDADEDLLVDAETRELRLTLERSISRHWAARIELPYRSTGAGSLDSFIDSWHDFFGLPQGMRPLMPRDRFHIAYERDGHSMLDMQSDVAGIGDASVALGYRWTADDRSAIAAWLDVKVPTGDADKLTGSGATDVTLVIAGEHRLAARWSTFGQLYTTWLGEGDILPVQQRDLVFGGFAGIGFNAWRGLDLKLQFDAHTAAFDADLDYLGPAGILTVGGSYRFRSGWQFDFGVSEDVVVDASPDVVFVMGIRR